MCICCITAAWGPGRMVVCAVVMRCQHDGLHGAPVLWKTPPPPRRSRPPLLLRPEADTDTRARRRHPPLWSTPRQLPTAGVTPTTARCLSILYRHYKYISRFMSEDGHRGDDLCAAPGTDDAAPRPMALSSRPRRSITAGATLWSSTTAPNGDGLQLASPCTPT